MVATHDLNYANKLDKVFRIENGLVKIKMNNLLISGMVYMAFVFVLLLISIVLKGYGFCREAGCTKGVTKNSKLIKKTFHRKINKIFQLHPFRRFTSALLSI